MKAKWSVLVVYDGDGARQSATQFCDRLVERFWAESEFDVSWCSFDHLEHEQETAATIDKAANANLVVFAAERELPLHVLDWVELWLARRGEREGVLVGLPGEGAEAAGTHLYFRHIAHRAGMDYLTELPQSMTFPIPESPESCAKRAHQLTSTLDGILQFSPPPPRCP